MVPIHGVQLDAVSRRKWVGGVLCSGGGRWVGLGGWEAVVVYSTTGAELGLGGDGKRLTFAGAAGPGESS